MSLNKNLPWVQIFGHTVLALVTVAILAPFALMIVSSFTDDTSLIANGLNRQCIKWYR